MLYSISGISVGTFPKFLKICSNSFIYNYLVLLHRNKWYMYGIYKEQFGMILCSISQAVGCNIAGAVGTIYYNIFGAINPEFDGIFHGIFYNRNELD